VTDLVAGLSCGAASQLPAGNAVKVILHLAFMHLNEAARARELIPWRCRPEASCWRELTAPEHDRPKTNVLVRGVLDRSGKRRRAQAVSRFDAHKKRYVPELEVLREWVTLSGIILGAAILPVAGAYCLALLTSW
jgi:hypothetical protein